MISIYEYIADNAPEQAEALCNKYGWTLQGMENSDDLANCLHNLVAEEGEPALTDMVGIHPDKDLIIEVYTGQTAAIPAGGGGGCACGGCKGKADSSGSQIDKIINAATGVKDHNSSVPFLHQSNLMIIGGIVLIGLAIVLKNKD